MPKGKMPDANRPNSRRMVVVARKSKIGTRKSVQGALQMSNDDLRKVLDGSARPRDKAKATRELVRRGAALVIESVEES